MSNLLNLDDLIDIERYVNIRGQRYLVMDRSVGMMLEAIEMSRKSGISNEEEFLQGMIRTIQQVLPDCPISVVESLTMQQMAALLEYVNQDPRKLAEQATQPSAEESKSAPQGES